MQPNRTLFVIITAILLFGGCSRDPIGADNRMAQRALGQCRHEQALQLTDNAIERGSERNAQQALMLKAAILRDRGDQAAAEALYPQITETWEAIKRRTLSPEQREREIRMFIDVARNERIAQGIAANCGNATSLP
ncbi:MAG: hypothetical protein N838_13570 [Thiohalocapsa sp. PB-PSB1]|jgi:hypothetical protein|nr:MAG: hypothetical protein N838_13570 [Thiohalocapsa sp. PB-PSB1]